MTGQEPVQWELIDSAPWGEEVMLTGNSRYWLPHDRFFINGYRVRDWHNGDWNDATGTRLSENGWHPTHWLPLRILDTLPLQQKKEGES